MGASRSRALLVVVLLLVVAALVAGAWYLTTRDQVIEAELTERVPTGDPEDPVVTDPAEDPPAVAPSDDAPAVALSEDPATVASSEELRDAPNEGGEALGTLEVDAVPAGVRLAVIGPDRFVHVHSWFGQSSLGSLRPGIYRVIGTLEGHEASSQEVEVTAGRTASVSLTLEEGEGR